uniref:Myofilin protein n=1 Tax=Lethocerus indicus TaxID=212017 RepID=Q70VH9_LETIN|nr:myofilin protein [Lethocerus indicus]
MLLHNHLDMIGRNEPIQRKAKFWQSYVRALKGPSHLPLNERLRLFALSKNHSIGTDDIRAPEALYYSRYPRSGLFRPLLSDYPTWPNIKSIYDDPLHAADRITVPGYRYLPISREIYGLSQRNIYPHHYSSVDRYPRHGDKDFASRIRGEFKHDEHSYFEFDNAKTFSDWDPHEGRTEAMKALPPETFVTHYQPPKYAREYTPGPDGRKIPIQDWVTDIWRPARRCYCYYARLPYRYPAGCFDRYSTTPRLEFY